MSTEAGIGTTFVFQVYFVDAQNQPVAALSPTISIFWFNTVGLKQVVLTTSLTPDLTEVGRFVYPWPIPTSFAAGDVVYGMMTGIDPLTGDRAVIEETLNLVYSAGGGSCCGTGGGMRARFVR